jgi:hypothetical protein
VELPFTVNTSNGRITGTFRPEGRELKIENGTVKGNDFNWIVKRERQNGGVIVYKMSGTIKGDKIAGKSSTEIEGNPVDIEWSARRK